MQGGIRNQTMYIYFFFLKMRWGRQNKIHAGKPITHLPPFVNFKRPPVKICSRRKLRPAFNPPIRSFYAFVCHRQQREQPVCQFTKPTSTVDNYTYICPRPLRCKRQCNWFVYALATSRVERKAQMIRVPLLLYSLLEPWHLSQVSRCLSECAHIVV